MLNMLLEDTLQPDWITNSFPIIRIVLFSIIVLCAIIVIIATLMQSNSNNNANVLGGVQESYYAENKGLSRDGKLRRITIICSSIIFVSIVLYLVSLIINKTAL